MAYGADGKTGVAFEHAAITATVVTTSMALRYFVMTDSLRAATIRSGERPRPMAERRGRGM